MMLRPSRLRGDDVSENAASAQPKPFSPPRKDNRLTKQQIISIVFSLITGSAVAANPPYPNIVQYGEATAVRHEQTQALYQAMHAAIQQSYDLAQLRYCHPPVPGRRQCAVPLRLLHPEKPRPQTKGRQGKLCHPNQALGRAGIFYPCPIAHPRFSDGLKARQVGLGPDIRAADIGFATQATRLKIRNLYFQTAFEQHSPQAGYPYPASLCRTTNAGSLKTGFPLQKTSDSGIRPATYRKAV